MCEYINTTKENPDLLGDNKKVDAEVNAEKPQIRPVFRFHHQSAVQIFLFNTWQIENIWEPL